MSLLLQDLAREKAASNRRIAQAVELASERAEELRKVEATLGNPRMRTARNAREAMRYALLEAAETRTIWQSTRELFEEGLEGGEAKQILHSMLELFESWFGLAKTTRNLCQQAVAIGVRPEGLENLDVAEGQVQGSKKAADEMKAFLSRPRPPVSPGLLEKARQAVAQGRFKSPKYVDHKVTRAPS